MTRPSVPSIPTKDIVNRQQIEQLEAARLSRATERSTLPAVRTCSMDFGDR